MKPANCAAQAEAGLTGASTAHGLAPGFTEEQYRERLDFELERHRRDEISRLLPDRRRLHPWAKNQGIPVGPGRGSGAGSLVSYALTITDLDPMRFGLLFERFLNPERVSMPDFDIDFCQDRRDEVIHYVQERYGRDQVAQIITFGTLAGARRAARCRPRLADAVWPGRQAVQDGAAESGRARHAGARHRGRAEAAGRSRQRSDRASAPSPLPASWKA